MFSRSPFSPEKRDEFEWSSLWMWARGWKEKWQSGSGTEGNKMENMEIKDPRWKVRREGGWRERVVVDRTVSSPGLNNHLLTFRSSLLSLNFLTLTTSKEEALLSSFCPTKGKNYVTLDLWHGLRHQVSLQVPSSSSFQSLDNRWRMRKARHVR